jgi:transcriptional regulator with XRE-family HTH domain
MEDEMTDESENAFKTRLVEARSLRGISQVDLSRKTGIPQSSFSQFETGARKPSFDNLRTIAKALDVSTDYLMGRTESPGLPVEADELYRHGQKLNDENRALALNFMKMLEERGKK